MPYRKKNIRRKKGARKGRRYKKFYRKFRHTPGTNIQRQLVVADRTFTKFKYSEVDLSRTNLQIPAGGAYTLSAYNANSLFQHVPSVNTTMPGLDEWSKFYIRYRVHAVKVKVYMVSNDATSTGGTNRPLMGLIHLQSDPAPGYFTNWASVRQLQGNRYSTFKPLAINELGGQVQPTYLKKYYKFGPASGNPKQFALDDTYEGTTNGLGTTPVNPNRIFSYYIGLMTMDGTNTVNTQNVSIMLTTTLYVEFKDRIDLVS